MNNKNLLRTAFAAMLFIIFKPIQAEELQTKQLPPTELTRLNAGEYDPMAGAFVDIGRKAGMTITDETFGNPKYSVTIWVQNQNNNVFAYGDKAVFGAKANHDGFLSIFNYDANNEVTQLYPNKYSRDNYVRKGQTILIPPLGSGYEITAGPPAGNNIIIAYITDLPDAVYDKRTAQSFNDDVYPSSSLDGKIMAKKFSINLKNTHKENWGAYRKVISIVPNKKIPPPSPVISQNINEAIREESSLGLTKQQIKEYQVFLRNEGYYRSTIDGIIGNNTRAALKSWQNFNQLPATGYFDVITISKMR